MEASADIVVLAAGRGSRMRSAMRKPLLHLAGEPLLAHVLSVAKQIRPRRIIVVVPPDSEEERATAAKAFPAAEFAVQPAPRGTADAAARAAAMLRGPGIALVLCADAPLLSAISLRKMRRIAESGRLALLTFEASSPQGYGRVARDKTGAVSAIVEERDANAAQKKIQEAFAGALAAPAEWLRRSLGKIRTGKASGEKYLTALAEIALREGSPAAAVRAPEAEAAGVNTPAQLAEAEHALRLRRAAELMARGVSIADPARADFRGTVRAAAGARIDVNVILHDSSLGAGCEIGAHSVLIDCKVGPRTRVLPFCHLEGASIGADCSIGPFARIRPGSSIGREARVGNFVEVKNSALEAGAKAGHLAYLGDARVGAAANIGAGAITCNYDGRKKHRTVIGAGAFVGSGAQLIAPVKVGRGAYVAAGTALSRNAPAEHLAIARAPQTVRPLRRRAKS